MMARELETAFQTLHRASRTEPAPSLALRRDRLDRLRAMVMEQRNAIMDAIAADFGGRSRAETELLEILPLLNGLKHTRKHLPGWMRDERRHVSLSFQPARAWIRHEPLGVIGIISPWNYPLLLALAPLVDALGAGNRALIKPSELTPGLSDLLAAGIAAHFAPEEVAVVTGGVDVAKAFSRLPFDHLVFTGSIPVGRDVMRAAADNLTPVTLELGGKSPAILLPGYPIDRAAKSVAFGKFLNAGQTCIAPDYALVPAAEAEGFAKAVIAAATTGYPSIEDNDDYSNIISERHRARLNGAIEEARKAGATILSHPDASGPNGKIAPTVVLDPPPEGLLMTEEIFGPILPVVPYRDLDDAVAFTRRFDRPLALYAFANSAREQEAVLGRITSGGVTLNGTLLHIAQDDLPFGGVGASGIGAYHGVHGFRRFSHARAVHKIGAVNVFEKIGPPWGRLAGLTAKLLAR
jgi:coniferyl-aldehyde dehydrogenase